MMRRAAAIIGTADTWSMAPWEDHSVAMIALNDSYVLGLPRIDEFYELHPLDKMYFRPKNNRRVLESAVPKGFYVRPEGHIDFLRTAAATIPVWLQQTPPDDWPANACRFPIEALEAKYGTYWASGPAYELMHLYERGYRDIHIYGIHLATDHERRDQRHNFEFLIGRLLGPEVRETREGELRVFTGMGMRIVLPVASPLLQHGWRYAYESKPQATPSALEEEAQRVAREKRDLVERLVQWPTGQDKSAALARLQRLAVIEIDIQQQMQRAHLLKTPVAIQPVVTPTYPYPVQVQIGVGHG